MFSGLSVLEALCILFASTLYNELFPVTYTVYPGFVFFIMAFCSLLIIPLMWYVSMLLTLINCVLVPFI